MPDATRGQAVSEFVLKIRQLCNLACDYCYMYEMADQSFRGRPAEMSWPVLEMTADRIRDYVRLEGVAQPRVILHGGEPLLAGPQRLARLAQLMRDRIPGVVLSLQTNGVLLKPRILDVLLAEGIGVGVSIDGAPAAQDRHRRFADGRGSSAQVAAGLELLGSDRYASLFSGLLCVASLENDPLETYRSLLSYRPPALDFLLPLANHVTPPARGYGRWLGAIFDEWYAAPVMPAYIRLFGEIMHLAAGGAPRTDFIGQPQPGLAMVIESDGSYEMVDALKSAYEGAAATGLHVSAASVHDAAGYQQAYMDSSGVTRLHRTCQECLVRDICHGGYYPHRWDGASFLAVSAYCEDLMWLISHITHRMREDLAFLEEGKNASTRTA